MFGSNCGSFIIPKVFVKYHCVPSTMLISGDTAVDKRNKNSAYEENPEKKITLTEC